MLLCKMLSFHDDASAIEELLQEEVEALRVTPPATEETEAMLKSRLILIRTLIERLEKVGRGSKAAGRGLVQVLLFRCLFPEAVPMLRPSAEVLKLAGMPPPIVHGGDDRPNGKVARGSKRKQDDEELPDLGRRRRRRGRVGRRRRHAQRGCRDRPRRHLGRTRHLGRQVVRAQRGVALLQRRGGGDAGRAPVAGVRFAGDEVRRVSDSSPISVRTTPKTWWR